MLPKKKRIESHRASEYEERARIKKISKRRKANKVAAQKRRINRER